MKVQELINRLADFRQDAEVVIWTHDEVGGNEFRQHISHILRDGYGNVGINWNEDGTTIPVDKLEMTDE